MDHRTKEIVNRMMNHPEARVWMARAVKEGDPQPDNEGKMWATYRVGETLYIVLAIGPVDPQVENIMRAALGHDTMSFVKGD
jgi:hypothetical protein